MPFSSFIEMSITTRAGLSARAGQLRALVHADETHASRAHEAKARFARVEADAVVVHRELEERPVGLDADGDELRLRVARGVAERLLGDAVARALERGRQARLEPGELALDRQAGGGALALREPLERFLEPQLVELRRGRGPGAGGPPLPRPPRGA